MNEFNRQIADRFSDAGIPVILLDRNVVPFPQSSHFDVVGLDNSAAGYLLAEHLIKLGCKHIAFMLRPLSAPTVERRYAGIRVALAHHQMDVSPDWLQMGDPLDPKFVHSLIAGKRWDAIV